MLWCFIFSNWSKCTFAYLFTCLASNCLPSLLTYPLPVPYIRKCCWTDGNFSKNTLGKLYSKEKGTKVNFRFHNETYVFLVFNIQININCKKYIIVLVLIFSQFKPLPVPKNLVTWFRPSYATDTCVRVSFFIKLQVSDLQLY